MTRLVPLALVLALAPLAAAQTSICPGLVGDAALACVADAYRPSSLLSLAESKDRLYDTVDRTSRDGQDGVAGFYTGHFVPFDCAPSCDPSQDVYKVVFAIHDFHLGLRYATITDAGSRQTLVWRSHGEARRPIFDSLEAISRLSYFDFLEGRQRLEPATEDEALARCLKDLTADPA